MAPPLTWVITRRDGTVIAEDAPVICKQFDDGLGVGVGALGGDLVIARCTSPVDVLLQPDQSVLWPCVSGVPVGAYTVQGGGKFGKTSTTASFTAARVDAELFERQIFSKLVFGPTEQRDIARDLIRYGFGLPMRHMHPFWAAQVETYGPAAQLPLLRLDTTEPPQGQRVLREVAADDTGWSATKAPYIGKALQDFAQQIRGFEVRLDYGREPPPDGRFYATVRFGTPNLTGGPLPLQEGPKGNVVDWAYTPATGKDTRTLWRQIGKGPDGSPTLGPAAVDEVERGLTIRTGSGSSESSDTNVLLAEATAALRDRTGVRQGWMVTLRQAALTTYQIGWVGDLAVKHDRFGGVKHTRLRIIGHTVNPETGQVELNVLEVP